MNGAVDPLLGLQLVAGKMAHADCLLRSPWSDTQGHEALAYWYVVNKCVIWAEAQGSTR